jgi:actin-related protein 5
MTYRAAIWYKTYKYIMDIDAYIVDIPRPVLPSLPPPPLDYEGVSGDIIIDNGATSFRWGFTGQEPRTSPNVVAKYKDRRTNKPLVLFGDAVDCETGARGQARAPWEGDVLLNFDALVCPRIRFSQRFSHRVTRKMPSTMPFCKWVSTPLASTIESLWLNDSPRPYTLVPVRLWRLVRQATHHASAVTSELLFELYSVPEITYCIDGVMSFYQNNAPAASATPFTSDGLVVSFNTASTSVIPILNGKGILSNSKRYYCTSFNDI